MKLLLDEDVPKPLLPAIRQVLPGHEVVHVDELNWKGKQDTNLLADAARRGFDGIITNDSKQLDDADECRAIRDSAMHHIRYRQQTGRSENGGLNGLALAMAAILAAIRNVVVELDGSFGQRLVLIQEIRGERRHQTIDPATEPPAYWPSRPSGHRRNRRPRRS